MFNNNSKNKRHGFSMHLVKVWETRTATDLTGAVFSSNYVMKNRYIELKGKGS